MSGRLVCLPSSDVAHFPPSLPSLSLSLSLSLSPSLPYSSGREYKEPDGSIREERRYQYSTMWRQDLINSNDFDDPRDHHNPSSMPLENEEWTADRTAVGRYTLSREAVWQINNFKTLHLNSEGVYKLGMHPYANKLYSDDPHHPKV